jgi:hypothetical protein
MVWSNGLTTMHRCTANSGHAPDLRARAPTGEESRTQGAPPPPDHGFTPGQHARTPIDGSEGRRDSSAARTNSTAMVAHRGRGLGLPGAEVSEVGFIPRFHPHLQQIEPNFMRGARSSRWIRNVEEKALTKWARATVRQRRGV